MTELDKLEKYLKEKGIRYERIDTNEMGTYFERHQIAVPSRGRDYKWDAICHYGSFGYEEGLLEIYGSLVDEEKDGDVVVGWLTAEDVIERIEEPKQAESGSIPQEKSKNESVKTTDDLISRQTAIDAFKRELTTGESNGKYVTTCCAIGYEGIKRILESIPSAQPERKRGKWIPGRGIAREYCGPTFTIDYENYKCSSCGLTLKDLLYNVNDEPFYKYCPNCGAEMKQ